MKVRWPFCTLALPAAWLIAGCAGTTLPFGLGPAAPRAASQEERPENRIDTAALHSALDQYAEEQNLFVLYPRPVVESSKDGQGGDLDGFDHVAGWEKETALQEVPGPKADDHLIDLWQKDLDKAMQAPEGRRKIQFSIPVVENDRVRYFVDYFCGRKRGFFETALARSGKYIPMMASILQEEGLPEDLIYLSLIESGFSPKAFSRAKAAGPWQFILSTGRRYGLKINAWVDERRDPVKSTRAAAAYLKDLHLEFGEWFLAAAAYNAGERKLEKVMSRMQTDDFWRLAEKRYLKSETRNYVPKFIAASLIASTPEKYGFGDIVYEPPMEYEEVTIDKPLRLETVARLANTTIDTIKELNPALLRSITPPAEDGFTLRLPAGSGEGFAEGYASLPASASPRVVTHKVKRGESLVGIAKRYRQKVKQVMQLNGLRTRRVRPGQELVILLDGASKKR